LIKWNQFWKEKYQSQHICKSNQNREKLKNIVCLVFKKLSRVKCNFACLINSIDIFNWIASSKLTIKSSKISVLCLIVQNSKNFIRSTEFIFNRSELHVARTWSMNDTDSSTSISQRWQVLRSSEEKWNVTLLKSKHTAVLASNGETTWSIGNNYCRNYSSIASERRMFFKPISSLHLSLEKNRYSTVRNNDRFTLSYSIFIETCARTVTCKSSLVDDALIAST
jgi:hypothetical protein